MLDEHSLSVTVPRLDRILGPLLTKLPQLRRPRHRMVLGGGVCGLIDMLLMLRS